ncbi:MAG: CBS domain-containing protein [Candidatus Latescibacteria bacterium]|nr:CBS domain-containing protein [Candidatus Latescibacterota bacterium]
MAVTAADIMQREVISVQEELSIADLVELLYDHRISGVPVVDAGGALVGVISATDVLLGDMVLGQAPVTETDYHTHVDIHPDNWEVMRIEPEDDRRVRDLMSTGVITARPDTPVDELAGIMYTNRIHRLIVLEGELLAGIVTTIDILRAVMEKRLC